MQAKPTWVRAIDCECPVSVLVVEAWLAVWLTGPVPVLWSWGESDSFPSGEDSLPACGGPGTWSRRGGTCTADVCTARR